MGAHVSSSLRRMGSHLPSNDLPQGTGNAACDTGHVVPIRIHKKVLCPGSAEEPYPAVEVYCTGRARNVALLECARNRWWIQAKYNAKLLFTHTPGVQMVLELALSKAPFSTKHSQVAQEAIARMGLKRVEPK